MEGAASAARAIGQTTKAVNARASKTCDFIACNLPWNAVVASDEKPRNRKGITVHGEADHDSSAVSVDSSIFY